MPSAKRSTSRGRKLSRYAKFVKAEHKVVSKAHPSMKPQGVMKALGAKWRCMSDAQKAKYGKGVSPARSKNCKKSRSRSASKSKSRSKSASKTRKPRKSAKRASKRRSASKKSAKRTPKKSAKRASKKPAKKSAKRRSASKKSKKGK